MLASILAGGRSMQAGPPFPWRSQTQGPAPYTQRQPSGSANLIRGQTPDRLSPRPNPQLSPSTSLPKRITARKPESLYPAGCGIHFSATHNFLNELIRAESHQDGPVRDCILGADVVGSQSTDTQLQVRLLPDPTMARFDLLLTGVTRNQTENRTPQAIIHAEGHHRFEVSKTVQFDGSRLLTRSPAAWLYPHQCNRAALTPASGVPILGPLVSQYALGIAEQRRPQAERITAAKITQQVAPQFDRSIDQRLASLNQTLQSTLPQELRRWGIEQPRLRVSTTPTRLLTSLVWNSVQSVSEYSVSEPETDDSRLHMALHADVINAWLSRLPLGGQEIAIRDLERWQTELHRQLAGADSGTRTLKPVSMPRTKTESADELSAPRPMARDRSPAQVISDTLTLPGFGEPTLVGPILPPPREPTLLDPTHPEETQKIPTPDSSLDVPQSPADTDSTPDNVKLILAENNPLTIEFQDGEAVITIVTAFQIEPAPPTGQHRIRIPLRSQLLGDSLEIVPGAIRVEVVDSSSGPLTEVVRHTIEQQVQSRVQPTRWPITRRFDREQGGTMSLRLASLKSQAGWLSIAWGMESEAPATALK